MVLTQRLDMSGIVQMLSVINCPWANNLAYYGFGETLEWCATRMKGL